MLTDANKYYVEKKKEKKKKSGGFCATVTFGRLQHVGVVPAGRRSEPSASQTAILCVYGEKRIVVAFF